LPAAVETVFLDRDGTINAKAPEGDYVKSAADFRLLPDVAEAVGRLRDAGRRIVVVTNQRGIALGVMTEADLDGIHRRMLGEIGPVDAIYHCPHAEGECDCRKPLPGMLLRAGRELQGVDFAKAVMVGDSASDMQAGRAVGARLVMIGDPEGEDVDYRASSLLDAAEWLLTTPVRGV
jgi:D-glycero-D-manno-heptose 1,7-bisphosphate phosphatase